MSKPEHAKEVPMDAAALLDPWVRTYIRKQREKGWTLKQLAQLFHVSESTISRICNGGKA